MFALFSMKDERWGNLTIGKTKLKLKDYGCFIVCLAMIKGLEPDLTLKILNKKDCFTKEGLLTSTKAASALSLEYKGISFKRPDTPQIAETAHYRAKGVPQHFFIDLLDGYCIDPLDGLKKPLPYKIVSWRLFYKPETTIIVKPEIPKEIILASKSLLMNPLEKIIKWLINLIKRG